MGLVDYNEISKITNLGFRNCVYEDLDFILKLKELCFKWYIEIIYGWDVFVQRDLTSKELDLHLADMQIIQIDNNDIGLTTFYKQDDAYVIGMIVIHPDYQNKGIATNIIKKYIEITRNENKKIILKTYQNNPARRLYERLGFRVYDTDKTHVYLSIDFNK